jgi:hypothetical protein
MRSETDGEGAPIDRGSSVSITFALKTQPLSAGGRTQLHAGRSRGYDNDRNSNNVDDGAHRAPEEPDRCRVLMRADRPGDWGEPQCRHRQGKSTRSVALQERNRNKAPEDCAPQDLHPAQEPQASQAKPQIAFEKVSGDSANRCSLFELQQWHCRWPISEPGAEDFGFCGSKMVDGLPYCEAHARMAYRPGRRGSTARSLTMPLQCGAISRPF